MAEAVKEEGMPWNQVCGANGKGYKKECMDLFGVNGVPSCVLIDKEGKIVKLTRLYNEEEFASLVQAINEMLK